MSESKSMSLGIHNLIIIILTLLSAGRALKTLVDTTGEQRVSEIGNAALILPNTTELGSLNILQELTVLRALVVDLQNRTTQLEQNTPQSGCAWSGVGCHCHLDDVTSLDAAVLLGSNCTNGVLHWVKVLDSVHVNDIFVTCEAIVNATILASCDVMF